MRQGIHSGKLITVKMGIWYIGGGASEFIGCNFVTIIISREIVEEAINDRNPIFYIYEKKKTFISSMDMC